MNRLAADNANAIALIFGGAGYIGRALAFKMSTNRDVVLIDREASKVAVRQIMEDLSDPAAHKSILGQLNTHDNYLVYYCAGFFPKRAEDRENLQASRFYADRVALQTAFSVAESLHAPFYYMSTLPLGRSNQAALKGPLQIYFESKALDEGFLLDRKECLPLLQIIRLARVVGLEHGAASSVPDDILSSFIRAIWQRRRIKVDKPGMLVPYVYLPDLTRLLIKTAGRPIDLSEAPITELGSPDILSAWEIVSLVGQALSTDPLVCATENDQGLLTAPEPSILQRPCRDVIFAALRDYIEQFRELSK